FFFQAEDGIRDFHVTGVQTCALPILSSMTPEEVYKAIRQGNKKQLQTVKGIGLKTAERMILELKDKVPEIDVQIIDSSPKHNTIEKDALNALMGLGIAKRSEEHTSELQSRENLVCRLLLEK